ncbi:MAG TPA: hypothetical protein DCG19_13175, partial [Cryomorphaceae bacterium]|nr:hypothetical protein [Cryomorphaceae bacterium]
MKKVFPFILLITVMALSCKKDDGNGGGNGAPYPTDNLTLEAKTNSFMLVPYAPGSQSSITSQILAKEFENKYGDLFTHLNMVAGVGHPFYSFTADSILKHFGNPPSFLLNGQVYTDFEVMQEAIELAELKKPVISVVHKVTENDTSWIVDAKIEFYKDTSSNRFTIETYMVLEVPGIVNGEIDLRFPIVTDVINQDDKRSFWTRDIPSLDSSEIVARVNDTYIHNNVVYKNFNKKNPFGTNLAD